MDLKPGGSQSYEGFLIHRQSKMPRAYLVEMNGKILGAYATLGSARGAISRGEVGRTREKNPPSMKRFPKQPRAAKKKNGWFEIRVNGKLVYTAASLESAKLAARAYHRKHPGARVTGHRI